MDKILKVYVGGTAGGGSKAYNGNTTDSTIKAEFQGGLSSYRLRENSNYIIDQFSATVVDNGETIVMGDIWRLLSLGGVWIGGGRIIKEPVGDSRGMLKVVGEDWTGVLMDRIIDRTYDGETGDTIIKDILNTYFGGGNCDYNINQTLIDTPSNTITQRFQNRYAYDVIKEVAAMSVGANDRAFDFKLIEDPVGTLKFKFYEGSPAASVTLSPSDIHPRGFGLRRRNDFNYNGVTVFGATNYVNHIPLDLDYWTEDSTSGYTTRQSTVASATSPVDTGSKSIKIMDDVPAGAGIADDFSMATLIFRDDVSATKTPTGSWFSSTFGYRLRDDVDTFLSFKINCSEYFCTDVADSILFFSVAIGSSYHTTTSSYPNRCWEYIYGKETSSLYILDEAAGTMPNHPTERTPKYGLPVKDTWQEITLRINDYVDYEAPYLYNISFILTSNINQFLGGSDYFIDKLRLYQLNRPIRRSYPVSPAAPIKQYLHRDSNINHEYYADSTAEGIYDGFSAMYEGSIALNELNTNLSAGDSVTIEYPSRLTASITSKIDYIEYTPYTQSIHIGRSRGVDEAIRDAYRLVRRL